MFVAETVSAWCSALHDDSLVVRKEALKVLHHAIHHSTISFCIGVYAHGGIDDLHQRVFNTEILWVWRSTLHDNDWNVRQEALKVLGLAINHSMLPLLY